MCVTLRLALHGDVSDFVDACRRNGRIALLHSDVFGNVLSQSGAFRGRDPGDEEPNVTARKYLAVPRRPIRFYLETGLYDNVPGADLPLYEMVLMRTERRQQVWRIENFLPPMTTGGR